jgi:2-polyprenyl-3-methyl-5-hydroxy-6-metoxy-1,4-benzoquinol methylase
MDRNEFASYKKGFVDSMREMLREGGSLALHEAAFPAYAHQNPFVAYPFWLRVKKVMDYLGGRHFDAVLDFGCGSGVMLPFLSRISDRVVAADVDLIPLNKMMSLLPLSDVEIRDLNCTRLADIDPASFDLVLALDVLEHMDDLSGVLRDLVRIAVPGGMIIVSGPTENFLYRMGRRLAGPEFTGDYHVRNIYEVRKELGKHVLVNSKSTIYYPLPLFEIYSGIVPS